MRLTTKEEIDKLEQAIMDGKAKFEFMSDKNQMIGLLNIERSKLSNNAGNKLSR